MLTKKRVSQKPNFISSLLESTALQVCKFFLNHLQNKVSIIKKNSHFRMLLIFWPNHIARNNCRGNIFFNSP